MTRRLLPFCALALFAVAPAAAEDAPLRPCADAEIAPADCGTVTVPERTGARRTVALDVVVLRATGDDKAPDPLFVLQGGPGQAATPQADFYARTFAPLRARRDIWLVDVRGTGRSNSLHCPVAAVPGRGDMLPAESVRACRATLAPRHDLTSYTTRQIVADLEAVRRRFRLPAINLYGTSYGTRLGLEYMRMHPRSVRTATLSGVVPAQADAPVEYGAFAQAAFARYAALCRADAGCAARFPDPAGDLARARSAVAASFARGGSSLSPELFGELVRMELYGPGRAGGLFQALQRAAAGDLSGWENRTRRLFGLWSPEALSLGMFLSVTCADFMPAVDPERARRISGATFAGTYRTDQQRAACAIWNVPASPRATFRPVHSTVPVLLLSGELDPVTPPGWAEAAARTLTNGRTIVIRNNGHALGPAGACVAAMMAGFIETRDPRRVDASCADDLPPPDFRAG